MPPESLKTPEKTRLEVAGILLDSGCVLTDFEKEFTFSSGVRSPIKVDCEKLLQSPNSFKSIISELEKVIKLQYLDFDFLCGVIKGGIPLAQSLGERFNKPSIARLGKKRDQVRTQLVSGGVKTNSCGLIIEDVLTFSTNSTLVAEQLRREDAHLIGVAVIFDYGFRLARDNLLNHGLRLWSLTNFSRTLEIGKQMRIFNDFEVEKLKIWWQTINLQSLPN